MPNETTVDLCKHDGQPCHASVGTNDAHWRCGTAQCSPAEPSKFEDCMFLTNYRENQVWEHGRRQGYREASGFVTTNLSNRVRFRFLGEKGENVWRDYWAPYCGGRDVFEFLPADENGWRETELHILMQTIGPSFVGGFTPIETDIQVEVKCNVRR